MRPQPQQTVPPPPPIAPPSSETSNTSQGNPGDADNSTDREARFSLYDFPSDSESEERPLSSGSKGKNVSGDQKSPTKVVGVGHSSPTKKPFKKFFPKSKKLLEKQPPPNNNSKEEVTSTATSKDANKMQEDVAVQPTGTFTIYVWNTSSTLCGNLVFFLPL